MGLRTRAASLTLGTAGLRTGWKAQCRLAWSSPAAASVRSSVRTSSEQVQGQRLMPALRGSRGRRPTGRQYTLHQVVPLSKSVSLAFARMRAFSGVSPHSGEFGYVSDWRKGPKLSIGHLICRSLGRKVTTAVGDRLEEEF